MKFDQSDADILTPIIRRTVAEVLEQRQATEAALGDRLGFTEPEAAGLLGVKPHVLRDARLRREIDARRVGARYIYSRSSLLRFLEECK